MGAVPTSGEQNCPCNLSRFPWSLKASARCLQSLQECPRAFELRLKFGCCAQQFTSYFHVSRCCTSPSVSSAHLVLVGTSLQLSNAKFVLQCQKKSRRCTIGCKTDTPISGMSSNLGPTVADGAAKLAEFRWPCPGEVLQWKQGQLLWIARRGLVRRPIQVKCKLDRERGQSMIN